MTDVDTTVQFLMSALKGDNTLKTLVDNKIVSEYQRSVLQLGGTYKTIVGVSVTGSDQQSYFMSQVRGYIESDVTAQITVLSGYESNDQHCRKVVKLISDLCQDLQYIGTYRIFVNSIRSDVKPDSSTGKWIGTIILGITRFDPIV